MTLRALRDGGAGATEGKAIPSWVSASPFAEHDDGGSQSSGLKEIGAEDTVAESRVPGRPATRTCSRRRAVLQGDSAPDALEWIYRQEGDWEGLVDLYTGRIETVGTSDKGELLKRLGEVLWHELGDATAARYALVDALAIDPGDDEAAADLEDIATSCDGGWRSLVDAVSRKIDAVDGAATRARLAERIVRWARGDMNDAATAERFLGVVRAHDPAHPLVHQRLASNYAGVGDWEAQRASLERVLTLTTRDEDRRAVYIALGDLYDQHLPNAKLAAENYAKALEVDPCAMAALTALERICRTSEQYVRLAEILDRQVDAATTDEERVGALLRLGELLELRFVKARDAVAKYEVALELDPGCARARDGLERCWHAVRDWEKLGAALESRAASARDLPAAIAALTCLAEVREAKQGSIELALAAWRSLYELDTSHEVAIHELARLSEKQGDITAAAAYRARLADLTDDPREQARIHVAVGEMLSPEECDPGCARIHFERAVEMDPGNAVAWEQLQKLAAREGDPLYAAFCLERRAGLAESSRLKGQLLVELARMRATLGDGREALATFELAFDTDPTNETAARAVLESWTRQGKWEDAQRACDVLVAAATRDADAKTLLRLLRLSTRAAMATGNGERALMAAAAAHDLAPANGPAQSDVLHVCYQLRHEVALREHVGAIAERVAKEAMDLSPASLVRLAEVRLVTGDANGGVEMLCLALAHEGENADALVTLARVSIERGDWGRAANCKHRLARVTEDVRTRQDCFIAAADLWSKHATMPARAVAVLEEALERDPSGPANAAILQRMVGLWGALNEWVRLVAALRALGALEEDPVRHAMHVYASAGVLREKLGDLPGAAQLYEEVLDLDRSRLDAFEYVVRLWTDLRDWRELEVAYRRMLGRHSESGDKKLVHALHHQLGLVYRDRLGDLPRALESFQEAARLAPEGDEDSRIVVELLLLSGQPDLAMADMRRSLKVDATRPTAFRGIYDLFLLQGLHDRAWCAANALSHLGEANPVQRRFVDDFPPMDLADVPGTLASCAWDSHLIAPGMDAHLSAIFRKLVPAVVRARTARLPANQRRQLTGAQLRETDSPLAARLLRVVRDGAEILGVPSPRLLSRPDLTVPFVVAPTLEPTLFVSLSAAAAVPEELLVFLLSRRLAVLRPELVAHALFPTHAELNALLKSAMRVAVATRQAPPQGADDVAIIRTMEPNELNGLRETVDAMMEAESRPSIRQWHQQADLTMARAAMLLTGDFDLAWRGIQREPRSPSELTPNDWRCEMLRFVVSDEYGDLRQAIGVGVEGRAQA